MNEQTRTEVEAAAFRRLVDHLREHADVQNIDLMNLAGFCRNCLSKWYRAAAEERGEEMSYEDAREIVYAIALLGLEVEAPAGGHARPAGRLRREAFRARIARDRRWSCRP